MPPEDGRDADRLSRLQALSRRPAARPGAPSISLGAVSGGTQAGSQASAASAGGSQAAAERAQAARLEVGLPLKNKRLGTPLSASAHDNLMYLLPHHIIAQWMDPPHHTLQGANRALRERLADALEELDAAHAQLHILQGLQQQLEEATPGAAELAAAALEQERVLQAARDARVLQLLRAKASWAALGRC